MTDILPETVLELPEKLLKFLEETASIEAIPQRLCGLFNADECVIWKPSKRLEPRKPLSLAPTQCRLYPLTSTFKYPAQWVHSGLPLDFHNDSTGRIYKSQWENEGRQLPPELRINNNFPDSDKTCRSAEFISNLKLERVCISIFSFDSGAAPYAVCLYRRGVDNQGRATDLFCPKDAQHLDLYARLIPALFRKHINRHFRSLIRDVHNALTPAKSQEAAGIKPTLDDLCKKLATAFHCHEVSILLCERGSGPSVFTLKATTLEEKFVSKRNFRADRKDGLTGYALSERKVLEFHDLRNFNDPEMLPIIKDRYGDDITWTDSANILAYCRSRYPDAGEVSDKNLPPAAFLAVPIIEPNGGPVDSAALLGLIRCSLGTNPYYFTPMEKEMLSLVATSLGHWWSDVMEVSDQKRQADLFKASMEVHDHLQETIWAAIHNDKPDGDGVIPAAIRIVFKAFKGVKLVCFRKQLAEGLQATHVDGPQSPLQSTMFAQGEYPLAAPLLARKSGSPFRWLTHEKIQQNGSDKEKQLYDGMKEILSVQVGIRDIVFGVLDFGFSDDLYDSSNRQIFEGVTQDIAKQVGLYEQVRLDWRELEKTVENQILMTQSVGHQIKSPLANARDVLRQLHRPLNAAQHNPRAAWNLGQQLERIVPSRVPRLVGMVAKAQAVGRFMESFGKLSRGQKVVLGTERWNVSDLSKLCWEIAKNNQAFEETREVSGQKSNKEDREFGFTGEFEPKLREDSRNTVETVRYSKEATEQVLDAVLGNALKYCSSGKSIEVNARLSDPSLIVTIINWTDDDMKLSIEDARMCFEKGWRGLGTSGYVGSGLGLWIAKALMEQQGGTIEAFPTENGKTRFALRFPRI